MKKTHIDIFKLIEEIGFVKTSPAHYFYKKENKDFWLYFILDDNFYHLYDNKESFDSFDYKTYVRSYDSNQVYENIINIFAKEIRNNKIKKCLK